MKRREFLTGSALAGVGTMVPRFTRGQVVRPDRGIRQARNVIFLVYDGFSWEDFAIGQHYSRRSRGKMLALERLLRLGACGSMCSHSLTSIVTDSSAASTAWGTGRRTANANVAVYPDGRKLTTILELAREKGRATGLITTTRITHATPAGFLAHNLDRNAEDEIALDYLAFLPDVLMGGGARHFDASRRSDGRDLFSEFARNGYSIARTSEDLAKLDGTRVLCTFSDSHLPFEIDRLHQGAGGPSLAEMTRRGLQILSGLGRGFVLQVEAGRIDHANHSNDPASALWDVLAADEALEVILNFADTNPDTLLIMASDHGTGGAAIYGIGSNYHRANASFDSIASQKGSFEYVLRRLGSSPGAQDVADVAADVLGVRLSGEEAALVADSIAGNTRMPHLPAYHQQPDNTLGWVLSGGENFYDPDHLNIHFSAGQHTAGPVPIALYGDAISRSQLGLVDITEGFEWMSQAIGSDFENPVMSEEEAWKVLEQQEAEAAQTA